eukprot:9506412-Alexandrium_andersonii.AAC.1
MVASNAQQAEGAPDHHADNADQAPPAGPAQAKEKPRGGRGRPPPSWAPPPPPNDEVIFPGPA